MGFRRCLALLVWCAMCCVGPAIAHPAFAQSASPENSSNGIPAPQDTPYAGVMTLTVDATDLERRILSARQTIPVTGGTRVTLLYPQWLPGQHGPNGRVDKLAGLMIRANGERLTWLRDPGNVFAFHVDVPSGVTTLDLEFQYMSPLERSQGREIMSPDIIDLTWESVVLYPAGYYARQIPVEAKVRLPQGWQFATALETDTLGADNTITFRRTSVETLVDSPILAGRYFKKWDLDTGAVPVRLNVAAEKPDDLAATPKQIDVHRAMVSQTYKVFGTGHFAHYDFLLALSSDLPAMGLEHLQSSENTVVPEYFTEWDKNADLRTILPHELVHSWNGKARRPADLWQPNFNTPMQDSLLWVYEGQTQYWGVVLAARSGVLSKQQTLDSIAATAAQLDVRAGRTWRNLQDTTNEPIMSGRRASASRSWQRGEDYYSEGLLLWLDADTLIRQLSNNRRSLDDFARAFFGTSQGISTYTFDDVVKALNAVQSHDWAGFLRERLDNHGPGAPLDGLKRGGYRIVFRDTPTDYGKIAEARRGQLDLLHSLGLVMASDGRISEVLRNSLADRATLTSSARIIAVNGQAYSTSVMKDAVTATKTGGPLELIVRNGDKFRVLKLEYQGGLKYPHLERDTSTAARLDEILSPK